MLCHPLNPVLSGFAARASHSAVGETGGLVLTSDCLNICSIYHRSTKPHFNGPYALDGEEKERDTRNLVWWSKRRDA